MIWIQDIRLKEEYKEKKINKNKNKYGKKKQKRKL